MKRAEPGIAYVGTSGWNYDSWRDSFYGGRPKKDWLRHCGERFSALDPYAFMLSRWTRGMQRPARTLPHLGAFQQRMLARPAVQKVFEVEGLAAPLV